MSHVINIWTRQPISDVAPTQNRPGLAKCNARLASDVPLERICKSASDAHQSLARLDRIVEEARKRAMNGDRAALAVLATIVDDVYQLVAEARIDLEGGK
jgi:hypothetical protein